MRRLQPDVQRALEEVAALNLPPLESRTVRDARAFVTESDAQRPPGPEVGDIVDGVLPGAAGALAYRLYRPPTPGPHPIVVYFHGGGWVLGDAGSDDPFCRDLCLRSGAIIVSANYRHAPEHPFPAAVHDAYAATTWVAESAGELGGIVGQLAVAGWSAGGNLATVVCQLARDNGGPTILGQALLAPVTDSDLTRDSYLQNAEGYGLSTALMRWFHTQYSAAAPHADPRLAPLRAAELAGLPPAIVVTAEFDPLRDEGIAYAAALAAAGVPTTHLDAPGQTHLSLMMVDVVLSAESIRAQFAAALRRFTAVTPAGGVS